MYFRRTLSAFAVLFQCSTLRKKWYVLKGLKENYMTPMNIDPGNEVEGPNVIDETKPMNQAQEKRKSKKP
jgi:hypothetical protein